MKQSNKIYNSDIIRYFDISKKVSSRLPKEWLLSPFLSLSIAKNREILGIGMENRQRDGFFVSLVSSKKDSRLTSLDAMSEKQFLTNFNKFVRDSSSKRYFDQPY